MNNDYLARIKANMKERKVSVADIASWTGNSKSWIYTCLNGHYPYRGAGDSGNAIFPVYLTKLLRDFRLLPDES